MKQIIKQLMAVAILFSVALSGYAYDFEVDGIFYGKNSDGKTVYVTYNNYSDYSGSVVIPSEVTYSATTYSVTSIGSFAFRDCSGLTSVTIPNSVTSISSNAFSGCSGLTSIIVVSGNAVYDSRENCNAIIETSSNTLISGCQSTTIPDSVTEIGESAFEDCSGLTSVSIPNSVTSIGDHAFYNCKGLTSVTIGNSVTSIGDWAFEYCSGLTSVTIPNSVTSIGSSAFYGCTGLTSMTIPESVISIGYSAFENCSGLTSVTIGNSVTEIFRSTFSNCSGLISVNIGNSVTSIGEDAFWNCSSLTSITIPNSVTSIGYEAFCGCCGINQLIIQDGSSTLYLGHNGYSGTFSDAPLESVYLGRNLYYNNTSKYGYSPFYGISTLTELTIGNLVTLIDDYSFENCTGLTSVTIPNSVSSIGFSAFSGCSGLTSVIFNAENCEAMGDSNFPVFGGSTNLTSITIGNKVKTVPNYAFMKCNGLTSIDIPISVKSIGDMAFSGCNLTKVTCRATLPPTISETTFSQNVYDDATLYVYANSEDYYRDDEYWQNFYNVQTLSGGSVIEPVQLSVLFPDRGKVAIDVPYNKAVTLTVFPNGVAGFGLSSATFNGVEIFDELDENYRYTTPVLTENAVLSVVYVSVPSGVDQSLANRIKVSASNGTVRVMGAAPESEVLVCDLFGKIVRKSAEKTFTLGEGIYVLNVEGLSFKFAM